MSTQSTTSLPPRKTPANRPTDEEFLQDVRQRMREAFDRHPGLEAFYTGPFTPCDADEDDEFMQRVRSREFASDSESHD